MNPKIDEYIDFLTAIVRNEAEDGYITIGEYIRKRIYSDISDTEIDQIIEEFLPPYSTETKPPSSKICHRYSYYWRLQFLKKAVSQMYII